MIAREIYQFFEKITNPNSICKGFSIYESYGKISGRAYSGKISLIELPPNLPDYLLAVPPEEEPRIGDWLGF